MTSRRVRSLAMLGPAVVALFLFASFASDASAQWFAADKQAVPPSTRAFFNAGEAAEAGSGRDRGFQARIGLGIGGGRGVRAGMQAGSPCERGVCPTPVPRQQGRSALPPAPPEQSMPIGEAEAIHSAVRISIDNGQRQSGNQIVSCGSGAIVYTHRERSIVLTCSHIFDGGPTAFRRVIDVEVFGGKTGDPDLKKLATYRGKLIKRDRARDIALVELRPGIKLGFHPIVDREWKPTPGEAYWFTGFPAAGHIYSFQTRVLSESPMPSGVPGYRVSGNPPQGVSGGPLYADGKVAGVIDFSAQEAGWGLASTNESVYHLLDECSLTRVVTGPPDPAAPLDDRKPGSNLGSDSLIAQFGAASIGETPVQSAPAIVAMNPPTPKHAPRPTPEPTKPAAPPVVVAPEPKPIVAPESETNDLILFEAPALVAAVALDPSMVEFTANEADSKPKELTKEAKDLIAAEYARLAKEHPPTISGAIAADVKAVEKSLDFHWTHGVGIGSLFLLIVGVIVAAIFGPRAVASARTNAPYMISDERWAEMTEERVGRRKQKKAAPDKWAKLEAAMGGETEAPKA
jgi:hypothetical protein